MIMSIEQNTIYYNTLWLTSDATTVEIKKAYRRLSMKYHPDRNKWSDESALKFIDVKEAYILLTKLKSEEILYRNKGIYSNINKTTTSKNISNLDKTLKKIYLSLEDTKDFKSFVNRIFVILSYPFFPNTRYLNLLKIFILRFEAINYHQKDENEIFYKKWESIICNFIAQKWDINTLIKTIDLVNYEEWYKILINWFLKRYDKNKVIFILKKLKEKLSNNKNTHKKLEIKLTVAIWKQWDIMRIMQALLLSTFEISRLLHKICGPKKTNLQCSNQSKNHIIVICKTSTISNYFSYPRV